MTMLIQIRSLGDIVNKWRKSIGLGPVDTAVGALLAWNLKIPFTYCWSPSLVPPPVDWPNHIGRIYFFVYAYLTR